MAIGSNYLGVIGEHGTEGVDTAIVIPKPVGATEVIIQALKQNLRVILAKDQEATPTTGFQIPAGIVLSLPVSNSFSVIGEQQGGSIEYQFLG